MKTSEIIIRISVLYAITGVLFVFAYLYATTPGLFYPALAIKEFSTALFSAFLLPALVLLTFAFYQTRVAFISYEKTIRCEIENSADRLKKLQKLTAGEMLVFASTHRDLAEEALEALQNRLKSVREIEARTQWTAEGLSFFSDRLRGRQTPQELAREVALQLCKYLGVEGAIIYQSTGINGNERLHALESYGLKAPTQEVFAARDGLVGETAVRRETLVVDKAPADYLKIRSGLGESAPTALVLVPMIFNETLQGVIETAAFRRIEPHEIQFIERVAERVAATLVEIKNNVRTREMLVEARQLTQDLSLREKELTFLNDEMRAAQAELTAERARLQHITESIPDAIYQIQTVLDGGFAFTFISPRAQEILAQSPDSLLRDFRTLNIEDPSGFQEALKSSAQKLSYYEWEGRLASANEKWVKFSGLPQATNGGLIWNGVVSDVTFERAAKETLRLNDRALASIASGVVILEMRSSERPIVYANRAFYNLTSYETADVIGQSLELLYGEETDSAAITRVHQTLSGGEETYIRMVNYKKDQTPFWNDAFFSPVKDDEGTPTHYIAAFHDVTEQLKADKRVLQSEKMASLGQLIAGVAHEINTPLGVVKGAADNMLDYLPQTFRELPALSAMLPSDKQHRLSELVAYCFDSQVSLSTREQRAARKSLEDVLNDAGVPNARSLADTFVSIGVTGGLEPFGDILTHEENRRIVQVVYNLAQMRRNLNGVQVAVEKTRKIVFALKSYTHTHQDSEFRSIDLRQNIDIILTLYQNQLKYGVNVRANLQSVRPILGSADELGQVWTNILMNAIQAMQNQGELGIDLFEKEDTVFVEIADNGPGIPAHLLPRIFEPFFTTKVQGEGTGLGLDICKRIVEKHGGEISVTSVPGNTRFTVALPVAPVEALYQ